MSSPEVRAAPVTLILRRIRDLAARSQHDPVTRSSLTIMLTTVITSILGYVFWLVVARTLGPDASGTGAAATSALQATVLVASVGSAAALVEWLPRCHTALEWRQRATAGLLLAGTTAVIGGAMVVVLLGHASNVLPLLRDPVVAALFCVGAVAFALGTVIDYIAISERKGRLLLVRSTVMTGLRIPLLFVPFTGRVGGEVVATWAIAAVVSVVVAVVGFAGDATARSLKPTRAHLVVLLREMAPSFLGQHLITVAAMLGGYLLPLLVLSRLSAVDNGYFYITWMLGSVFSIISPAISTALFAEGSGEVAEMPALVRRSLILSAALLLLPIVVYLLGGGLLLSLFGPQYVEHGRLLLVLLTLAALPDAVTNIAVAVLRATRRLNEAIALNSAILMACLIGSWLLLPVWGIVAVGICWLGAQLLGVVYVVLTRDRLLLRPYPVIRGPA